MVTEAAIIEQLRKINDPEIGISVYDLGLIYGIELQEGGKVKIDMTLTTPGCPLYKLILSQIKDKIGKLEGITDVEVNLVWEPHWTPERLTKEGKEKLRGMGFNI